MTQSEIFKRVLSWFLVVLLIVAAIAADIRFDAKLDAYAAELAIDQMNPEGSTEYYEYHRMEQKYEFVKVFLRCSAGFMFGWHIGQTIKDATKAIANKDKNQFNQKDGE